VSELLAFARTYNGYDRLGRGPENLAPLVRSVIAALEATGSPPEWAGLDLLRGALFFMHRRTHHLGHVSADEESRMRILTSRIRQLAHGRPLSRDEPV
jgi:hypothetical protein